MARKQGLAEAVQGCGCGCASVGMLMVVVGLVVFCGAVGLLMLGGH